MANNRINSRANTFVFALVIFIGWSCQTIIPRLLFNVSKPKVLTYNQINIYLLKHNIENKSMFFKDTTLFWKYHQYIHKTIVLDSSMHRIVKKSTIPDTSLGCNYTDQRLINIYERDSRYFEIDSTFNIDDINDNLLLGKNKNAKYSLLIIWSKWLGKISLNDLKPAIKSAQQNNYNVYLINVDPNNIVFPTIKEYYSGLNHWQKKR